MRLILRDNGDLAIEGAKITARNFAGKAGTFNTEGKRNFCLLFPAEYHNDLIQNGWPAKMLQPKEGYEDDPMCLLSVGVQYNFRPPTITLLTSGGRNKITEHEVAMLDWAEILNLDLTIRKYEWEFNGRKGIKAQLDSMYVTMVEDEFAGKYKDFPDHAASNMDFPI